MKRKEKSKFEIEWISKDQFKNWKLDKSDSFIIDLIDYSTVIDSFEDQSLLKVYIKKSLSNNWVGIRDIL